jgi:hypothetical protein
MIGQRRIRSYRIITHSALAATGLLLAMGCSRTTSFADTDAVNADQKLSGFLSSFYTAIAADSAASSGQSTRLRAEPSSARQESSVTLVQSIAVDSPVYCSSIKGDVEVKFKAPGMDEVHAMCWQQPTKADPNPWGHDVDLAPEIRLDVDNAASFIFHANEFPSGPITIRIYAKNDNNQQDYCELQLFNLGGVNWHRGLPSTPPPAARGMKVAFADDFTGPLSISNDDSGRYWTHWGGGDGSTWPFCEYRGPNNPFSEVGGFLRIHASKPAGTSGSTGNIGSVHRDGTGIAVKAPCYFEARLLMQNAPGTWPAFWVTTNTSDPKLGCDEMDVIEGYGTTPKSTSGIWSAYHATTHFWGKPDPDWSKAVGPDGKPLHPMWVVPETMLLGGKSSWSTTFHTYGLLVTKTETVYYFDNIEVDRQPVGENAKVLPMGFLIDYAMGSGWPVDLARYGNQSDMWVDYVRLYQGA